MTDETFERIRAFCERNYVPDPFGYLGDLVRIPVVVDPEIPDDEPELNEPEPYKIGIRISRADFGDLRRRLLELDAAQEEL